MMLGTWHSRSRNGVLGSYGHRPGSPPTNYLNGTSGSFLEILVL